MVGNRIRDLRAELGMSQQELGDLLGISKVSICGYENGNRIPSLDIFRAMSDIFGVSTDYLLGREVPIVAEEEADYLIHLSKNEISLIRELKKYPTMYEKLTGDPKRYLELLSKKSI